MPAPREAPGPPKRRQEAQDVRRGVQAPRKVESPVPLERDVQRAAVAVLEALGCVVHRRNTGAMTAEYRGKSRLVRFSDPGASDLWAITPDGIHLEVELKRPGQRPSEAQVRWLLAHNGIGRAAAFWVDNVATLERVVRHLLAGGRVQFIGNRGDYNLAPGPPPEAGRAG